MAGLAERHLTNLRVQMVCRTDRFGRGGDPVMFVAAGYRVWWRRTTEPQWTHRRDVGADAPDAGRVVLHHIVIDDWFFGVSTQSADGDESPVVFVGEAGAF